MCMLLDELRTDKVNKLIQETSIRKTLKKNRRNNLIESFRKWANMFS